MKVRYSKDFRSSLRLSELPRPKWWGHWIRFFKSFEVLFFKILELLDLYRAQKSIIGIPTLATSNFTSLQAVVYNGTQEEVLGFKPRRLFHRILRGIPDLELFERVKFQVSFSENNLRTIEASSEVRGFIHLQMPWQLPENSPRVSWVRLSPMGVETAVGKVSLGDYELLSSPVFFLNDKIDSVIISDIDDTIKNSNVAKSTTLKSLVSGLFRGHYYEYEAIEGMAEFYQSLARKNSMIIYVTSTPYELAPFLLKFLKDRNFPEGPVFMRWLGYGRFGHKWRTINRVLSQVKQQKCLLIGDSGEQDLQIYRRICETANYGDKVKKILIRHIPGTPLQKPSHPRESFYTEISELKNQIETVLK
jgi:phosphatidate phosphatase APP1